MRIFLILILAISTLIAKNEKLTIDAVYFQAEDSRNVATFEINVKIQMGEDRLNAQKLELFFEIDKDTNKKVVSKYEATKKADFEIYSNGKLYKGSGDKIIYEPKKDEYNIIGNAFLHEVNEDRKVYGDHIYINQLNGEARVKGNEKKPVRFILNIDNKEKQKEE
ncbi:organic solvent tolerance protein OstA [Aliarcobacter skirrowii]|jgi:lipopolysaccharide export system protein LptA|uniref:Lipooligosaccharide transport system, periplasmic component LptA n=2 Tax=Aliarcobacter skirrowii TaxID=28200 RepID=A0AAD0SKM3_9BACT|nr:LptA/OstA family protein [Aliarcobacter skirrowii]MCB9096168.1 lipopolysaccharide transport periplasmic protein LptA [Arcobacter sp.]AXX84469.1 lipooligosaccharide transport system, periplasmic component LptA [Aliarcobacter skirrowii CCUG 10374]AZL53600.1 lipopolysaccharide transport periplasmic protein LptA [Aliarcobacter skirrowii]KAB0621358.1 lipopolysaccharide transport periplasmic protein LptA [Aliarcobacter skirrowii CCUG 10374]MDD2508100.1 LptA/OstA family protein [Aliarcobacter skir